MNPIERTTKDRIRKARKVTWWKVFLAGAIMMPAALFLRGMLPSEAGAAAFLAGAVCCIVGVIIGIVKGIIWIVKGLQALWAKRQVHSPRAVMTNEDITKKKKSFSIGKLVFWASLAMFIFLYATRTEDTGVAAQAARNLNTFYCYLALMGMCFGGGAWGAKRQKEDPKYQEQQKQLEQHWQQLKLEQERIAAVEEVKLLDDYITFKRGGVKGALLGGLFGGGIGAAVGAMTRCGRAVHWQRFAVKYKTGYTGTEEHEVGSRRYNELMRYVKWEYF